MRIEDMKLLKIFLKQRRIDIETEMENFGILKPLLRLLNCQHRFTNKLGKRVSFCIYCKQPKNIKHLTNNVK